MSNVNYHDLWWVVTDASSPEELKQWADEIKSLDPRAVHRHGPFTMANIQQAKLDGGTLICPGCNRSVAIP